MHVLQSISPTGGSWPAPRSAFSSASSVSVPSRPPAPAPAGPSGAAGMTTAAGAPATVAAAQRLGIRLGQLREAIGGNFRVSVDAAGKNGTRHILYVRGTIDVATSSVTVTLPDNSTQTFTVDSTTVVRQKGATVAFASLEDGEPAMVFGTKNDDGSYTAKLIRCVKEAKAAAPAAAPSATP